MAIPYNTLNYSLTSSPWDDTERDVVILGAGFSIAVNKLFPNTDELGTRAVAEICRANRLGIDVNGLPATFSNGQFETWLAQMSDDQPYLSTSENLRNRAIFLELTQTIRDIIVEVEEESSRQFPSWLCDFLSVCHARQSHLITLNYDTLIERCILKLYLAPPNEERVVTAGDILDGIPPDTRTNISGAGLRSLRLLKLHGSTSWYWVPTDQTGSTIQRIDTQAHKSQSDTEIQAERRRILPGREPFIIPPISGKGSLYNNPVIRELWTSAHDALRGARRVFLIGYSLPSADSGMGGLLNHALSNNPHAPILEVVNFEKAVPPILDRLSKIGIKAKPSFTADNCVEKFAKSYVDETSRHVLTHLQEYLSNNTKGQLDVHWGSPRGWYGSIEGTLQVSFDQMSKTLVVSTHTSEGSAAISEVQFAELADHINEAERLVIKLAEEEVPIVDYRLRPLHEDEPFDDYFLLSLVPAGRPRAGVTLRNYAKLPLTFKEG